VEIGNLAAVVEADQCAAMSTSVLEGNNLAVLGTGNHDRHRAQHRGTVVAGFRHIDFQAQEVPSRTLEHPNLLVARDIGIAIHPVGDPRQTRRPLADRQVMHRLVHVVLPG
jgi:hypothetical protein